MQVNVKWTKSKKQQLYRTEEVRNNNFFCSMESFIDLFNVHGEIHVHLEFLWHTALRASEDYVRGVFDGMVHGGSAPLDAHDYRSEDCEGQLASQPTHERIVWHIAFQRPTTSRQSVCRMFVLFFPYHLRLKV